MRFMLPFGMALVIGTFPPAPAAPQPPAAVDQAAEPAAVAADAVSAEAAPAEATPPTGAAPTAAAAPPAEVQQAFTEAMSRFDQIRVELAAALADQREVYVRYVNTDQRTPQAKQAYATHRDRVRRLIDDLYLAAIDVMQTQVLSEPVFRYLVTAIEHRVKHDIYNEATMRGAELVIASGSPLQYLYAAAARSAIVTGQFELAAKRFPQVLSAENADAIDRVLQANLESYQQQYDHEQQIRAEEALADRLPRVKLRTTQGDVVLELFLDQAPTTVANFIQLVEQGFYDGLDFYQVIDHVLALTGDPSGSGAGNSGKYIVDEHQRPDARHAFRGSLVMAKVPAGQGRQFVPDSASSQFAILFLPVATVSQNQTVFGRVIEGMDVVSRLRRVDPNQEKAKGEIVLPADQIIEATVLRKPESMPQPQYSQPTL